MKAFFPILFVVLLWTCFSEFSGAQNPVLIPPADAASARSLLVEAQNLFDSAKYDFAEQRSELAYHFFKVKPGISADLAEAGYLLGQALHKQERYLEAKPIFEEAIDAWAIAHPVGSVEETKTRVALGITLLQLEDVNGSIAQGQKAIAILDRLSLENCYERIAANRLIGRSLYSTGEYNKAIPYYEEALKRASVLFGAETTEMARMMIYLGHCYNYTGFQERSMAILERALAIQQKKTIPNQEEIAGTYMALGSCQQTLKKYENALAYYEKAVELRLKINSPRLAYAYSKMGQICLENLDYGKSLDYFQKESEVLTFHKLVNGSTYAFNCRDFGLAYLGLKEYEKSIQWLEKARLLFQGPDQAENSGMGMGLDQCYIVFHIGRAKSASGAYEEALQLFLENQKMLHRLFDSEYPLLYESNAEIAHTYAQLYLKTKQDSFLTQSRAYFRLAKKGVESQLHNEIYQGSERMVLADARSYFERAIGTELLYLNNHPDDPEALENAWQFSEAMHSYLLFSSTQEANARHFAGIPDSELSRDSLLREDITSLEKKRQSLIEHGYELTDSLVLVLSIQISAKKEAAQQLHTFFEKRFPDYFCLKYENQTSSLAKTQKLLSSKQTLLEYFTGDSSIFVFIVQREDSRVFELPRDFPLDDWIKQLREGISNYYTAKQKEPGQYEKTVHQYADAAQKLYEKLIAPIADSLTPEIIIVPGDGIANLPFEALLSAAPKDVGNFNTYPFVVRQHSVQYAYSATMLHQMSDRTHLRTPSGELLAFAPFFEEDTASLALRLQRDDAIRLGFSALPFSGEEVFRAKKRCLEPSKVLTGKVATKQKFLEMAGQFKVLHLATHGKANHLAGDFSFLAFASEDGKTENGLLSVGELYNLSLNADLVLLSACETGIGEQQRGEGVVSLARAFAFAGAKSIVASLWSVNDKSTMQVMDNFYAGIKSGQSKNIALANAKLEYLAQNPGLASHPFFWAGFVGVGDLGQIKN